MRDLSPYFPSKVGAPAKPIRLVSGLFMLQHCIDCSNEEALQTWLENPYWQFFCGYDYLLWELPLTPSSLPIENTEKITGEKVETAFPDKRYKRQIAEEIKA